ncbi:HlyD family efflux transporter periplasmic adaptor subunit [Flammeovirga pectinis]|uniref:HlyD family efflux transporter periplasmic adaptor subunit n=1 Tax=Flammeovirga pectinis TaxID=2494373 RepID=A0A3S9P6R1_9BACT|nr:HlyD family efflux transporter periplasmic adaptor subunit [Flammeovirga pectinis]AZQ63752.1 HlyD family efflux transporter periplasmic adaptor subunit [Flammeovirga pectinis]
MQNLEIRDELYRNIHKVKPSWWMNWGISIIVLFLIIIVTLSNFIRYSDTVIAEVRFMSVSPSVTIPSKVSTSIYNINVKDKGHVKKGDILLSFQNNAITKDILEVKHNLRSIKKQNYSSFYFQELNKNYELGDIQMKCDELLDALYEYIEIVEYNKFDNKIKNIKKEKKILETKQTYLKNLTDLNSDLNLILNQEKDIDSVLYTKEVISSSKLHKTLKDYINNQKTFENHYLSLNQNNLELYRLNNSIEELQESKRDNIHRIELKIQKCINQILILIKSWEDKFLIIAPINGTLNYLQPLNKNLFIQNESMLFTITPSITEHFAQLKIPFIGAGKIIKGQKVNIKINDYPYHEYGVLIGHIDKIANVANENHYIGQVSLENYPYTNYMKKIDIHENSTAIAEIIVSKRSLLERIFEKIIYVFN